MGSSVTDVWRKNPAVLLMLISFVDNQQSNEYQIKKDSMSTDSGSSHTECIQYVKVNICLQYQTPINYVKPLQGICLSLCVHQHGSIVRLTLSAFAKLNQLLSSASASEL